MESYVGNGEISVPPNYDIIFEKASLINSLKLIATVGDFNIIMSEDLSGQVSVAFQNTLLIGENRVLVECTHRELWGKPVANAWLSILNHHSPTFCMLTRRIGFDPLESLTDLDAKLLAREIKPRHFGAGTEFVIALHFAPGRVVDALLKRGGLIQDRRG